MSFGFPVCVVTVLGCFVFDHFCLVLLQFAGFVLQFGLVVPVRLIAVCLLFVVTICVLLLL